MTRGHTAPTHSRSVYADVMHCTVCRQRAAEATEDAARAARLRQQLDRQAQAHIQAARTAELVEQHRQVMEARAGRPPFVRALIRVATLFASNLGAAAVGALIFWLAYCVYRFFVNGDSVYLPTYPHWPVALLAGASVGGFMGLICQLLPRVLASKPGVDRHGDVVMAD